MKYGLNELLAYNTLASSQMPSKETKSQGVWVRDGKEGVLSGMQPSDFVFIYESKS